MALGALAALLTPALSAASMRAPGDGTLSLRDGRGAFTVNAKGGVIGSFVQGKVIITDPIEGDGTGPIVSGEDWGPIVRSETTTVYGGTRVRFRLIGGAFRIRVVGRGVNLSAVGKGQVTLNGQGAGDDGSYSVNGGDSLPIPDIAASFPLSVASP